ncbi:cell death abnormality protein 1 isoform X2 [Strongylocentrotus purpuratus]|uniref:Uncharacterized protein n=1 Tax=Strongylocentrotus purpuratus TaxID=7668 RepID=A0A7M7NC42_STRPU|nr:cell death abnormality protein 1 isoform X2 [Strongylocentrotus purpuratus]
MTPRLRRKPVQMDITVTSACTLTDAAPVICDAGYYSNQSSVACDTCDPGYACSEGSTSRTPTEGLCKQGYYCDDGLNELACPAGTYGNRTNAATAEEGYMYAACPEGYFCPQDPVIGTPTVEYLCPRGYFCEFSTETSTEHPCMAGSYGTDLEFTKQDDCSNCPIGFYCPAGTSLPRACPKGYYCPESTWAGDANPFPDGTFTEVEGPESQTECKTCPAGYYTAHRVPTHPRPALLAPSIPLLGRMRKPTVPTVPTVPPVTPAQPLPW